jgi:formate hydrogenlyase transcriptional activator
MGRVIATMSSTEKQRLKRYEWPGNIRELQNVIERTVITAERGRLNLDRALPETAEKRNQTPPPLDEPEPTAIFTSAQLQSLERDNLLKALSATRWRVSGKSGAAKLLGIPPSTLNSRLKALGLKRPALD